jgi:hypothetical protein
LRRQLNVRQARRPSISGYPFVMRKLCVPEVRLHLSRAMTPDPLDSCNRAPRKVHLNRDRQLMAEAIGVFDHELLTDLQLVGYTPETIALVDFAPLVRIAWADGYVSKRQRAAVFQVAVREHIRNDTPADLLLRGWLERCPPDEVSHVSLFAICAKLNRLRLDAREALQRQFIRDCTAVALGADSVVGDNKIASEEGRVLARILVSLRPGPLRR